MRQKLPVAKSNLTAASLLAFLTFEPGQQLYMI